jgi:PAS domain S-box-containing protein
MPHDAAARPPLDTVLRPRMPVSSELLATLYEILESAILVLHGKFGNLQLYDPARRGLETVAHRGFDASSLAFISFVSIDTELAAARSIRCRRRVVVANVNEDPLYAPYREFAANAGFKAVQSTPLISKEGEILGVLVTHLPEAREFTAHELQVLDLYSRQAADAIVRARVESDLATARSRLDAALRVGEMGVYDWDMASDRVYGDPNYQRITGVPFDQDGYATRQSLYDKIDPQDREERLKRVQRAVDTGEPYEAEYRIVTSAKPRWVISRGRAHYDDAGKPTHFTGVLVDITARKEAEEALLEADRQKNAFLAQLAHELRNPLAPIRNAARIFRMPRASAADAAWAGEMIDRQVEHLTRLIDDLLDLSRISRNQLELRKQQTELREVVNAAVEISTPVIAQSGHQLVINLDPEPLRLHADPARLTQAVMNLLNNAAKYTARGGRIELSASRSDAHAVISVKDNGIGIEAWALPQVFNMFFQVDSSLERAQGGLGIGLSLVKSIVELHGGTVEAFSAGIGRGSKFIVRVPVQASAEQRAAAAAQGDLPDAKVVRRVLVADDNRDAAQSLALLLESCGHVVRIAADGEQALAAAHEFKPEVGLIDLGMPKLNGYEVCRRIRATDWGRDAMLIAQTGWGQDEDKRRTREAGFDQHLVKPADPITIMRLVQGARPLRTARTAHDRRAPAAGEAG